MDKECIKEIILSIKVKNKEGLIVDSCDNLIEPLTELIGRIYTKI